LGLLRVGGTARERVPPSSERPLSAAIDVPIRVACSGAPLDRSQPLDPSFSSEPHCWPEHMLAPRQRSASGTEQGRRISGAPTSAQASSVTRNESVHGALMHY